MRQDYILRLIAELRQFVAAMLGTGDPARAGEALHAVLHAQERLFQRPPAEFLALMIDEQVELLGRAESPAAALEKVITFAATLKLAAEVYDATNRDALAASSRQLALGALLTAAQRWPESGTDFLDQINRLKEQLPDELLNPTVRELLEQYRPKSPGKPADA